MATEFSQQAQALSLERESWKDGVRGELGAERKFERLFSPSEHSAILDALDSADDL